MRESDPDASTVVPEGRDAAPAWYSRVSRQDLAVQIEFEVGALLVDATVVDISKGGLFAVCETVMRVDTEVEFDLPLAGETLHLLGRVVWTREGEGRAEGMGIQFVDLDGVSQAKLLAFIAKLGGEADDSELSYTEPDFVLMDE